MPGKLLNDLWADKEQDEVLFILQNLPNNKVIPIIILSPTTGQANPEGIDYIGKCLNTAFDSKQYIPETKFPVGQEQIFFIHNDEKEIAEKPLAFICRIDANHVFHVKDPDTNEYFPLYENGKICERFKRMRIEARIRAQEEEIEALKTTAYNAAGSNDAFREFAAGIFIFKHPNTGAILPLYESNGEISTHFKALRLDEKKERLSTIITNANKAIAIIDKQKKETIPVAINISSLNAAWKEEGARLQKDVFHTSGWNSQNLKWQENYKLYQEQGIELKKWLSTSPSPPELAEQIQKRQELLQRKKEYLDMEFNFLKHAHESIIAGRIIDLHSHRSMPTPTTHPVTPIVTSVEELPPKWVSIEDAKRYVANAEKTLATTENEFSYQEKLKNNPSETRAAVSNVTIQITSLKEAIHSAERAGQPALNIAKTIDGGLGEIYSSHVAAIIASFAELDRFIFGKAEKRTGIAASDLPVISRKPTPPAVLSSSSSSASSSASGPSTPSAKRESASSSLTIINGSNPLTDTSALKSSSTPIPTRPPVPTRAPTPAPAPASARKAAPTPAPTPSSTPRSTAAVSPKNNIAWTEFIDTLKGKTPLKAKEYELAKDNGKLTLDKGVEIVSDENGFKGIVENGHSNVVTGVQLIVHQFKLAGINTQQIYLRSTADPVADLKTKMDVIQMSLGEGVVPVLTGINVKGLEEKGQNSLWGTLRFLVAQEGAASPKTYPQTQAFIPLAIADPKAFELLMEDFTVDADTLKQLAVKQRLDENISLKDFKKYLVWLQGQTINGTKEEKIAATNKFYAILIEGAQSKLSLVPTTAKKPEDHLLRNAASQRFTFGETRKDGSVGVLPPAPSHVPRKE